ncbi:hypothetical protein NO932_08650 [Pelagibacterium sp. 26DY04]|uniref:hypothetical protein n=1 Tax=Pelagibacterium sp. 26DY04 TaxID=2967130 RepID=UPI002816790D|nr:hypothetical protein [Pelagibacterium sp. 26DY04]WMT88658.1 hypothetical protein NO932_08650 [Pelagibacterium sp. 26DY04]
MTEVDDLADRLAASAAEHSAVLGKAAQATAEAVTRSQMQAADALPVRTKSDRQAAQWIAAHIDGRERRLQIVPEDIPTFEAANGGAYAALRALTGGDWTVDLVRKVLAFAAMPAVDRERLAKLAKFAGSLGVPSIAIPTPAWLDEALSTKPPAPMAGLAALVLTAALFGIPDDEAHWNDSDGA